VGASVGSQLLTYWGGDDKGDDLLLYLLLYL
jgi:hypothetical protein